MPTLFSHFQDVEAHLAKMGLFHQDLRLERMERALAALGLSGSSRLPFRVVQILGTNGKGSTAAFLDSLARQHGCRTGLYTSPHFVSPAERIRINGQPVSTALWAASANKIMAAVPELTYFEFLTVLALLLFQDARADLVILEAGLGGRHDATTAVAADLLCFTPVALDHCDVLGHSLYEIATDKAAAIRSAAPVCTAVQFPQVAAVLRQAASRHNAPLEEAPPLPSEVGRLGLAGTHQRGNAGLALAAWRKLAPLLGREAGTPQSWAKALRHAFIAGRLQVAPATPERPALLLDGAHNPHGMNTLVAALKSGLPTASPPQAVIFSCLADKDWPTSARMLKAALPPDCPVFVPGLDNPRAADPAGVCRFWNTLPRGGHAQVQDGPHAVQKALARAAAARSHTQDTRADTGPVLVTGSLYLLAEVFALYPRLLVAPHIKPNVIPTGLPQNTPEASPRKDKI